MSRNRNHNRARAAEAPANTAAPEQPVQHKGIVLDRPDVQLDLEREPLFTVGGVTYTIPVDPPAAWTAMALMIAIEDGSPAALAWSMRRMLGDAGVKALRECDTLHQADLKLIIDTVQARILPKVDSVPKKARPSTTGEKPSS